MTSKIGTKERIYSVIGWLVEHAWLFLGVIIIEFTVTIIFLHLFTKNAVGSCFIEAINVFMGDSPTMLAVSTLVDLKMRLTFIILLLLRFSGWLILPLVIGLLIDAAEERIHQQQHKLFLDEMQLIEGRESIDKHSEDALIEMGLSSEKAREILQDNREKFWKYYKKQIEAS